MIILQILLGIALVIVATVFCLSRHKSGYSTWAVLLSTMVPALSLTSGMHIWVLEYSEFLLPVLVAQYFYALCAVILTTTWKVPIMVRVVLSSAIPVAIAVHVMFYVDAVYFILLTISTALMCTHFYGLIGYMEDQCIENAKAS